MDAAMQGQLQELLEMYRPEPLHPDLVDHIQPGRIPGTLVLHHPWIIMIAYGEVRNRSANEQYAHKKLKVEEALRDRNWHRFLILHERPYRLDALLQIRAYLDEREYWKNVRWLWTDCENVHEQNEEWRDVWGRAYRVRDLVMNPRELRLYRETPAMLTIYRGFSAPGTELGLSWTTDYNRACWFARRWASHRPDGKPKVATAVCPREEILARLLDRNESEVVVFPESLPEIDVRTLE